MFKSPFSATSTSFIQHVHNCISLTDGYASLSWRALPILALAGLRQSVKSGAPPQLVLEAAGARYQSLSHKTRFRLKTQTNQINLPHLQLHEI